MTDVTLSTSLDPFMALLIWGTLAIVLFARGAFAPAGVSLMNLVATIPDPELYPTGAAIMFLAIMIGVHVIAGGFRGAFKRERDAV